MSLTPAARTTGQHWSEVNRRPVHAVSHEAHVHLVCAASGVAVSLLLILAVWHSAGAQSRVEPQMQASIMDHLTPARAPPLAGQGVALPPAYPVRGLDLRVTTPQSRRDGWGFVASVGGHSADLSSPADWAYNPSMGSGDVEAGLTWRHGDASAVVGYSQFDRGRGLAAAAKGDRPKFSRGVLGFTTRIKLP